MCIAKKLLTATFVTVSVYPLVSSYTSSKYTYPLCKDSYAFEINTAGTFSTDHNQCGFHFNGSHNDLSCQPLSLDGVVYPYIDLSLPDMNELKGWSFAVLFRPTSIIGHHVIFNYKYSGTLSQVTEVILFIDDGSLELNVVGGSGGSDFASLVMSVSIEAGYWTFVAVSKVYSTGQLKMAMESDTPAVSPTRKESAEGNNFPVSRRLEVPGTIRIGNNYAVENDAFKGEITCVTVYDSDQLADDVSVFSSILAECQTPWGNSPSDLPSSPNTGCVTTTPPQQTSDEQTTTGTITCARPATAPEIMSFRKLAQHGITGLATLSNITLISTPIQCASLCTRENCVAFTYLDGISKSCSLYSNYHESYISSDPDSHLYVHSAC